MELEGGSGLFLGIIEPVEDEDEDEEGPDFVISGASCIIIATSRFSLFAAVAEAAKEGIELALLVVGADELVDVDAVGVEDDDVFEDEEEETVVNSAGRWRACTSVMSLACLA